MIRKSLLAACSAVSAAALLAPAAFAQPTHAPVGHYQNFRVAIYVTVDSTRRLADRATFEREFERAERQTHFDKVYIEGYRDNRFATDDELERVKRFFQEKGIITEGGITLAAGGQGGQFATFDYENPADRATAERGMQLMARHFDKIILDDFFFYNTKSDLDIAAKGDRSWTQYRLDKMHEVARDVVIGAARQANPRVQVVIKYPNWYEHFQGLGFDLDQGPKIFSGIYTGTETRDPEITDQLLQQYESYEIIRFYDHVAPGRNGGGWVDTYSTRYVDRYAEQLWDTIFAKAPEITLFNWIPMSEAAPLQPGDRAAWASQPTTFDWDDMVRSYKPGAGADPGPGWGQAAGYALRKVDAVAGKLGHPIGIACYKPYQSSGEDFLQNYLGDIGLPIEMTPTWPSDAQTILLTEQAKGDPDIIAKIKGALTAGRNVVVTSGFVKAMQDKGLRDIVEIEETGNIAPIHEYLLGYGAGNGTSLNDAGHASPPVLFPEIRFYTNDAWPIIRGVASDKGYPIMLMDRYSKGVLYVLNVPENPGDLYNLPAPLLSQIKAFIQGDFPVRIESEPRVSLFAYDNNTFVVESFRDAPTTATVVLTGAGKALRDEQSGEAITAAAEPAPPNGAWNHGARPAPTTSHFQVTVPPHSFRVFRFD